MLDSINDILSFSFGGKTVGVLLDDYTKDLFDASFTKVIDFGSGIDTEESVDRNAVIMYGLGFEEIEEALEYSANEWTRHGLNTTLQTDCTINDFKHQLNGNDLIVIGEHGNYEYLGIPMIVTEERYTEENSKEYKNDIDSGRVFPVIDEDGTHYWIHPSFFSYYYSDNKLDGSMVWISSCNGATSSELTDAFLSVGVSAVIGYSDMVYCAYDIDLLNTSVEHLINGENTKDALDQATEKWGDNDIDYARDYFFLSVSELKPEVSYPCLAGDSDWKLS